jgi:uncharacterized protein (TIGR03067 family)
MRRFALLVAVAVTLPLSAAPVPKAVKKKADAQAILGRWQGGLAGNGRGDTTTHVFRFGDDRTCGITNTPGGGRESGAEYELHPDRSPRQMTWWNGSERTEWRCVYELDGDTLKVAFVHKGTDLPADTSPRAGVTVYELKRLTDDK